MIARIVFLALMFHGHLWIKRVELVAGSRQSIQVEYGLKYP